MLAKAPSTADDVSAHYIKAWREYRGMTQAELAKAIDIDRTYLNKIERGKRNYVPSVLAALANALDCAPGDLLSRHPDHSSEIETLYRSLSNDDQARAIAVLKTVFGR